MNKGKKLYEGKAKILYETKDKDLVIQHFKDDATAFNNQKKASIEGKGILNNRISEYILSNLNQVGIKNHLVKRINLREQLVKSYHPYKYGLRLWDGDKLEALEKSSPLVEGLIEPNQSSWLIYPREIEKELKLEIENLKIYNNFK